MSSELIAISEALSYIIHSNMDKTVISTDNKSVLQYLLGVHHKIGTPVEY